MLSASSPEVLMILHRQIAAPALSKKRLCPIMPMAPPPAPHL
eukprot:CAMPEP_0174282022 /NCGR_PEP_ID=MMETSP0809-20121228/2465_1 /TAXON_ID=73025 ORGANISM="Eutreptiella gymnastica-like, Strain CCMP1594" /NCGR_SAMPLE_ID=MMETSP0809 /ASSEMBLY_ACC=CAM_ASM_000658 /LENGTH=41 /DNA_ID= /DNA_START= /DNA_END= /DNA_ORIENTATION=